MLQQEVDFSSAQDHEEESDRVVKDDTFEMLRPYFREIGPVETLTSEEEVALAKRIDAHTAGLRREIFGIPFAARFVVERWSELRTAERVTATMSAVPADRREANASQRMDRALREMRIRGVKKPNSTMITSALKGAFKDNAKTREEFLVYYEKDSPV